jgi:hypothetical protein
MTFAIPASPALKVGGKKYTGISLRLDGEVPIAKLQKMTAGFTLQPFSSVAETDITLGMPKGGTVIGIHVDWNYCITDALWARLGFQFDSADSSYENSSTATDKRFAIGPGIYYSF